MTNNLHAHVSTASADCDGPVYHDFVRTLNNDERAEQVRAYYNGVMLGYDEPVNDFSEIHFMERVMMSHCSPFNVHQMRITVDDNGVEWHEDTEEGYSAGKIRWCREDSCDPDKRFYRDVFAESMGY